MMRPMAVVWPCPWSVEAYARAGRRAPTVESACPDCRAPLRAESGYWRHLRHRGRRHRLWVHRARCTPCGRSHALLPDFVVGNHLDSADTIAAAVAGQPDATLPASTVAGWRRRWRANHDDLVVGTSAALVAVSGVALTGPAAGSLPALVGALWLAVRDRRRTSLTPWRLLNVMTGMTWAPDRVNSSWAGVGPVPVAARGP